MRWHYTFWAKKEYGRSQMGVVGLSRVVGKTKPPPTGSGLRLSCLMPLLLLSLPAPLSVAKRIVASLLLIRCRCRHRAAPAQPAGRCHHRVGLGVAGVL